MNRPNDYEFDLEKIDRHVSELDRRQVNKLFDREETTRLAFYRYQRACLSGRLTDFEAAEATIDAAIEKLGLTADLCFLKASYDFKFHRLAETRRHLEAVPGLSESPLAKSVLADLAFQEGSYEDARRAYEALIEENRTWDNLARLAHFTAKMEDADGADRLYAEAEDELTAKEMRSFAWVELQRGLLDIQRGRYADAMAHYTRAQRAYSGYWLVDEHLAELLAAQGELDRAASLYERVIERVPRPEFHQALGELYAFMGELEKAQPHEEQALTAYLESTRAGDVHYYHHLVDFYADVREDGAEAVKWARRDLELRRNFSTQGALAWALYRNGQFDEAARTITESLSSGAIDAHLFHRAAEIHRAAGSTLEAERYHQLAAGLNPHHQNFHVHR
jgi:tetratricopeptide (TPR) repeat protein